jgi:hypothetical protein
MARKLIKIGGWYIAYEISSTAVLGAMIACGVQVPGF